MERGWPQHGLHAGMIAARGIHGSTFFQVKSDHWRLLSRAGRLIHTTIEGASAP